MGQFTRLENGKLKSYAESGGSGLPSQTGNANKILTTDGTNSSWALILNANIDPAAAIAYSKLNLTSSIVNADISNSAAIANSKLANMAAHTFKGNNTGSSATPSDLTATQLTAELDAFTSSLKGLVPASGGGTTNFLRADGAFAVPSSNPTFSSSFNLMLLDTSANSYAVSKTTNTNAETSVGDWVSYADSGTIPTDMTGGSPGLTIARNTTSPLNGSADFKIDLGSGSSRQGEGVSCVVNIPPAYRGKSVQFSFPFSITGTVIENDLKLFAYDITNAIVITPFTHGKLLGSSGKAVCVFPIATNCTQIRVGIHVARTTTGSLSFNIDDISVSDAAVPIGMAGSPVSQYTPTLTGFGTPTWYTSTYTRLGEYVLIQGTFAAGTVTHSEGLIPLPSGLTVSTKTSGSQQGVYGQLYRNVVTSTQQLDFVLKAVNGATALKVGVRTVSVSGWNTQVFVDDVIGTGEVISYWAMVPIESWSSNVSMAESSTFWISSHLASGSRITGGPPTKLGEYRSQLRNSSARSWTDTNGNPAITPTVSNGIALYGGNAWGSADTNNSPTFYDIFVGKNKVVKAYFWESTGKTGPVNVDAGGVFSSSNDFGYTHGYDPTTGLYSIRRATGLGGGASGHQQAYRTSQSDTISGSVIYFDIQVSENALAVGMQQPRSEIWLYGANGYGSTATKIPRLSVTGKSVGSAITYNPNNDEATNGNSFKINEDGVYEIFVSHNGNSATNYGISVDSGQLTTSIQSITQANRLAWGITNGADYIQGQTVSVNLNAGQVIRMHTDGITAGSNTTAVQIRITQTSR